MKNICDMIKRTTFVIILILMSGVMLMTGVENANAQHGGHHGGYYGYHGGYYGYHGGHYGWFYGGWWYPWAPIIAFLPFYYQTIWLGGYPYYYADGIYYAPVTGGYMAINPPPQGTVNQGPPPAPSSGQLFVYPRNGQSEKQQTEDRYQCHRWAVAQTGYDPTQSEGSGQSAQKLSDYHRAMDACLDARGYTAR